VIYSNSVFDELFETRYQRKTEILGVVQIFIAGAYYWIPRSQIDEITRTHITMTVQAARQVGLL
jgi:hypothetical protein